VKATTPTKSAAALSRQAILETAARLFRQEGYAATSLRSIAQACHMKAGSLYYHFASKDQIVSEVLDIGVQHVFYAVQAAIDALPPNAGLKVTVQCAIEAHLGALLHAHDFTSANIRIFGQVPDDVRASHKSLRKRYEQYWQDLLTGLQQRGEIRDGVDLQRTVFFLFGAMNWTTEWYDQKKSELAAVAGELTDLVTNGLQGSPVAANLDQNQGRNT
jgi:AcrR family transcriptional regulator